MKYKILHCPIDTFELICNISQSTFMRLKKSDGFSRINNSDRKYKKTIKFGIYVNIVWVTNEKSGDNFYFLYMVVHLSKLLKKFDVSFVDANDIKDEINLSYKSLGVKARVNDGRVWLNEIHHQLNFYAEKAEIELRDKIKRKYGQKINRMKKTEQDFDGTKSVSYRNKSQRQEDYDSREVREKKKKSYRDKLIKAIAHGNGEQVEILNNEIWWCGIIENSDSYYHHEIKTNNEKLGRLHRNGIFNKFKFESWFTLAFYKIIMEAWFKNSVFGGDHYKYDDACKLIERSKYFTDGKSDQRIMLTDDTKIKLMDYLKYVKDNCFEYDDKLYAKSKSQFMVQAKKLKNLDHVSISPICLPDDCDTTELKGLYNKYRENLKALNDDWSAKIALKAKFMNNNSNSKDLFPENPDEPVKEATSYETVSKSSLPASVCDNFDDVANVTDISNISDRHEPIAKKLVRKTKMTYPLALLCKGDRYLKLRHKLFLLLDYLRKDNINYLFVDFLIDKRKCIRHYYVYRVGT